MNYKIGIIGNEESVFPFVCLGFSVFSPETPEEIRKKVQEMAVNDYGIIYMTEDYISKVPDVLLHYDKETIPAVIPIPSFTETDASGIGKDRIQKMVEKAVGTNIL